MRGREFFRLGVLGVLTSLLSAGLVSTAAAEAGVAEYLCDNPPDLGDHHSVSFSDNTAWLSVFHEKSIEPTFNIAASDVLGNDAGGPVNRTASVTTTKTYTVQTTHKASKSTKVDFFKKVSTTFGYEFTQQITDTHTTVTATSDQITVQPHTAWRADRGIEAEWVTYDLDTWELADHRCWYYPQFSPHNVRENVPTTAERWDWRFYPTINPGGIVDGVNYSNNIHPGTVVAIFGNGFEAANTVIVRQNGRTWTIGAGSPWWYESYYQINAKLPGDLTPNQYATVSVKARSGLTRALETLWPRQVFITP